MKYANLKGRSSLFCKIVLLLLLIRQTMSHIYCVCVNSLFISMAFFFFFYQSFFLLGEQLPFINTHTEIHRLPRQLSGKESTCQTGDSGLIPGLGRSPGEGNVNLLQYSWLDNPMGSQRVGHDFVTQRQQHIQTHTTI